MGRTGKSEIARQITTVGIIPVVRADSTDLARRAIAAIRKGGVPIIEITMTVPGAVRMIEELNNEAAAETIIGAGTVLDAETARQCVRAGAQFIVSPSRTVPARSEEHTSELQSLRHLVCRLLLEKKK